MKLNKLFDYQKFANNKNMSKIIDEVDNKYYNSSKRELSLEEMSFVAAAGADPLGSIDKDKLNELNDED